MTAATLTRRPLRSMPAPRAGAFLADHQDERPCVTHPAHWWETGNPENSDAIDLCEEACPIYGTCKPAPREVGMIRDGVPYDDDGKPVRSKADIAKHHDRIVAMLNQGRTLKQIASIIGIKSSAIQTYLDQQVAA